MKPLNKSHVLRPDQAKEDHKVDLKSQEIFGPEIKDFDHCRPYLIKSLKVLASCLVSWTSISQPSSGEPRSYQHEWVEDKNVFNDPASNIGSQHLSQLIVVIHSSEYTKYIEANVFMKKVPRHDSFVRVVASIFQIRQYSEREVRRVALNNTYKSRHNELSTNTWLDANAINNRQPMTNIPFSATVCGKKLKSAPPW